MGHLVGCGVDCISFMMLYPGFTGKNDKFDASDKRGDTLNYFHLLNWIRWIDISAKLLPIYSIFWMMDQGRKVMLSVRALLDQIVSLSLLTHPSRSLAV